MAAPAPLELGFRRILPRTLLATGQTVAIVSYLSQMSIEGSNA